MPNQFKIPITTVDDSGKGIASAEKRFSKLSKSVSGVAKAGKDINLPKTFSQRVAEMEKATSGALGSKSISSMMGGRLGGVAKMGSMMSGAAESGVAAEAGGALEALAGAAGVAAGAIGAVVAVVGAAGAAVYDWSKNAAALGRLSAASGQAAQSIDAMVGAAETRGVARQQTEGSISGLARQLNDARYGRSNETLAMNNQLGLSVKTQANGAPDVEDFMGKLAGVIASQKNPQTQAEIARRYGQEAQLPLLQLGEDGYRKEVARAKAEAVIRDKNDTDTGQKVFGETTRITQQVARVGAAGSAKLAPAAVDPLKGVADLGRRGLDGVSSGVVDVPHIADAAVHALQDGVQAIGAAAPRVGHALDEGAHVVERGFSAVGTGLGQAADNIDRLAKRFGPAVADSFAYFREHGLDRSQAAGLTASLYHESKFNPQARGDGGAAFGIGQWHPDRQKRFAAWAGHDLRHSTVAEQRAFVLYEHQTTEAKGGLKLKEARTPREAAAAEVDYYERPKDRVGEKERRGKTADDIAAAAAQPASPTSADITVRFVGAPAGTTTRTTSSAGVNVRVERSMPLS